MRGVGVPSKADGARLRLYELERLDARQVTFLLIPIVRYTSAHDHQTPFTSNAMIIVLSDPAGGRGSPADACSMRLAARLRLQAEPPRRSAQPSRAPGHDGRPCSRSPSIPRASGCIGRSPIQSPVRPPGARVVFGASADLERGPRARRTCVHRRQRRSGHVRASRASRNTRPMDPC